jgi:D-sedoheptulose 7-phosphate isomerase
MQHGRWDESVGEIASLLRGVSFRDATGAEIAPDEGFERWAAATRRVREQRRTVYLVGNGASASMASHMAADLAKNAHLHTEVFSDLSLITAISNDMGYEHVFAVPLGRRAKPGDMLVAISSSGRSPNILAAVEVARRTDEVQVVTLSAMRPDNALRAHGHLNVYLPARTYGAAETCHAAILHHWMDLLEIAQPRDPVG